jgi:hypothetical protein
MFLFIHGNAIYSGTAYPGATKGPSLCKNTAGHTVILNLLYLSQSEINTLYGTKLLANLCRIYIQITHALLTCITVHIKTNNIKHILMLPKQTIIT